MCSATHCKKCRFLGNAAIMASRNFLGTVILSTYMVITDQLIYYRSLFYTDIRYDNHHKHYAYQLILRLALNWPHSTLAVIFVLILLIFTGIAIISTKHGCFFSTDLVLCVYNRGHPVRWEWNWVWPYLIQVCLAVLYERARIWGCSQVKPSP